MEIDKLYSYFHTSETLESVAKNLEQFSKTVCHAERINPVKGYYHIYYYPDIESIHITNDRPNNRYIANVAYRMVKKGLQ